MKRKVIQLAHKTLVVSLPSKWARHYGVKKGAELEVEERGQQIVFSTTAKSESEKIQIDARELGTEVLKRWVISSLHKTGYDEIEIMYEDASVLDVAQEVLKDVLIGFAVVEHTKNRFVIRSIADEQEKEFDTLLRRAFLVTKNMGDSMYDYLSEGKVSRVKDLLTLEKTINQLTNFCERIINKKGYQDDRKQNFAYVVVWNLEKIGDEYRDIAKYLSANPRSKLSKSTLDMLKDANSYFSKYYQLFYNFDMRELTSHTKEKNVLHSRYKQLIGSGSVADQYVRGIINSLIIRISDFSASFIALNLRIPRTS